MRLVYDKGVDAVYIYLEGKIKKGEAEKTISLNDNIILDFNKDEKLIGIEVLSASKVMPRKAMEEAEVTA